MTEVGNENLYIYRELSQRKTRTKNSVDSSRFSRENDSDLSL